MSVKHNKHYIWYGNQDRMKLTFLSAILKENYRMSDICKDREALKPKYEQFIQTERGKEWKHF